MLTRKLIVAPLWVVFAACCNASAQDCGDLTNANGPFDYRTASIATIQLVESYHFTPDVERLVHGSTSSTPAGDIDFVLRVFPNHPRALRAMINDGIKLKTEKPPGSNFTVACWLDRAERFTPDDGKVQLLYGIYLARKGDAHGAVAKLSRAQELIGDDPNVHYNLGLVYFDLRDYDQALAHAQAAYALGFPLPGLRNKLESVGKWQPAPAPSQTVLPPTTPDSAAPPAKSNAEAPPSARLAP